MYGISRLLIISGIVLLVLGVMAYLAARANIPIGRLPGDIRIQGENFTCVIPVATMILGSIILTIILNVVARLLNR